MSLLLLKYNLNVILKLDFRIFSMKITVKTVINVLFHTWNLDIELLITLTVNFSLN